MDDIQHHQPGGGWISGAMSDDPPGTTVRWPATEATGAEIELGIDPNAVDRRPEYNPAVLLERVVEVLQLVGIRPNLEHRQQVAVTAAADLLRALGVKPASAPRRDREGPAGAR